MAISAWPVPVTIDTTDLDSDTDSLTAARADLLIAVTKLNGVLAAVDNGAFIYTDLNPPTVATLVTSTAQTTYASGESWTYAHSQGTVPDQIYAYGVVQSGENDQGYTAGEKIMFDINAAYGLQVWANTSNLGAVVSSLGLTLLAKSTGIRQAVATGEWDIYIVGIWY